MGFPSIYSSVSVVDLIVTVSTLKAMSRCGLLTEHSSLTELDLGNNQYGDIQGTFIAHVFLINTSLTKLDLTYNYITVDVK